MSLMKVDPYFISKILTTKIRYLSEIIWASKPDCGISTMRKASPNLILFIFCHKVVSSTYPRLLLFLPAILIPACVSSSPAFLMMYSAYKLNKQGDNTQP